MKSLLPHTRLVLSAALLLSLIALPKAALAQNRDDDEPTPIFSTGKRPFVVVAASSANQIKEKLTYVFETAGYPEAINAILGQLDENVNGLNGLNWDRPAGIMVFLDSVIPPAFEFVAFLPMSDVAQFQSMMELGPVIMREDPLEEGRFELIGPRQNVQIRTQGDYAFIQMPIMDPDPAFDRDLPPPESLVAGLTSQFDIGVTLDVDAVPKATRDLIFNMISATMSTQMQQRDEEPDTVYAVRDAWQQRDLAGLKLFFQDTQRISFGWKVDPESGYAHADLILKARDASDMLKEIFLAATKPSYFTPLISDLAPISVSYSNVFAERDRKAGSESIEAAKDWLAMKIEEEDLGVVPGEGSPLFLALSALSETVAKGHLDMFAQIYRDANEKIAVVGALRVEDGDAVAAGLQDLLIRFRDEKDIGEIQIGYRDHSDIIFHRIEFKDPDAGAQELFGAQPGVMVGSTSRSVWFCIGGDASYDVLTGVMDELKASYENPVDRVSPAPMSVILHLRDLIDLVQGAEAANKKERAEEQATQAEELAAVKTEGKPAEGGDERARQWQEIRAKRQAARQKRNQIFLETLEAGEDMIHLEFRPTDEGFRMQFRFDVGFIKGVGAMAASSILGEE